MGQTLWIKITCDECGETTFDRAIDAHDREAVLLVLKGAQVAHAHDRAHCCKVVELGNEDLLHAAA